MGLCSRLCGVVFLCSILEHKMPLKFKNGTLSSVFNQQKPLNTAIVKLAWKLRDYMRCVVGLTAHQHGKHIPWFDTPRVSSLYDLVSNSDAALFFSIAFSLRRRNDKVLFTVLKSSATGVMLTARTESDEHSS